MHICALRHSGESLQNHQLQLRRWGWYLARESHKDTAVSVWACQAGFWKSTRTLCQQQNCQNWQYGLVSHSLLQMIMYRSAFCIAMSRLKCLVSSIFLIFFHSASWSNMTDPWQNFSEAEFKKKSVYHDRNYYYILLPKLWVMWLNHQRVTICFMKIAM